MSARPRRAVYRALVGGYEALREEEAERDSEIPFICLTDDPTLTSRTWQVIHVEPRLPNDSTRSARALKILGHPLLDQYDETLWLDNTVELKTAPDSLFDRWLADADVAAPLHSYRTSVLAEAEAVIDSGLDDFARVYEQLTHYLASGRDALDDNPHWTGMLARRRTPETARAMQAWWEDVLRYSRRDQLSFIPVMHAHGVRVHSVPLDTMESTWHAWPRAGGRVPDRLGSGLRDALRPPAARVGALQQQLDEAAHAMAVAVAKREAVITALEADLADAREGRTAALAELDTVRHERNLAHIDLAACRDRVDELEAVIEHKAARMRRMRRRLRRLESGRRASAPPSGSPGWRRAVARIGRR